MEAVYDYAILRVSPDARRGESVNVGVAVFLPHRLDVRILPSLAKVAALAPGFELDHGAVESAAETSEDVVRRLRGRPFECIAAKRSRMA